MYKRNKFSGFTLIETLIVLALVFAVLALSAFMIMNFVLRNDGSENLNKEICSFENINLRISGMRRTSEYEIINKGEKTEINLYYMNYADGEEKRIPEKTAETETDEFIEFLNFCNFYKWNGFYGKHPKNVLDGTMFDLTAFVNKEEILKAEGSENFPDEYRDFVKELDRLLNGGE